jgi:large subunit ribosomal protein L3
MGAARVTAKNVKVVRVDGEKNLLLVRGAIPGAVGASVLVRKSQAGASRAAVK